MQKNRQETKDATKECKPWANTWFYVVSFGSSCVVLRGFCT